ncbi:hypothetical protein BDK51DRAFT_40926 [Blyttiomyces helicus]|uniref:Derlin n=1 Tax=Blyttiomyces helicus TaxID=388810 RepID=A0A4P9WDZ1_9FUNG|nr:hypothetical protein BDK51DRAFT_40926 [Blyttiomyces helicus]|eukprot:RKO89458.1 hypothetical protein BDK51DRAFT_40926 [Blyttiomyces helicus]
MFPISKLVGIAVGHSYYFLDKIYPAANGGRRILYTPQILHDYFPSEGGVGQGYTYTPPVNPRAGTGAAEGAAAVGFVLLMRTCILRCMKYFTRLAARTDAVGKVEVVLKVQLPAREKGAATLDVGPLASRTRRDFHWSFGPDDDASLSPSEVRTDSQLDCARAASHANSCCGQPLGLPLPSPSRGTRDPLKDMSNTF